MKKRTVVITGSTRGIGLGLATEFLAAGHQVVINGRDKTKVSRAIMELQKSGGEVTGLAGSVSDEKTHVDLFEHSVQTFGKVDIWINNAGIPQAHMLFTDLDHKDIKSLVDTNIYGLMLGTTIATNFMAKQGFGKIFNMEGFGSDGRTMKNLTLYGTSKRAVNYFTKSIAKEVKGGPVQIGVISPGMVRTEFLDQSMKSGTAEEKKQFDKVYKILAEDVEVVTKYLVSHILKSSKNYDRISFLSGTRLMFKIFRLMLS